MSYWKKSPFELSGGQKRRVAIAGVMAMHPRVLVAGRTRRGPGPRGPRHDLRQIKDYHKTRDHGFAGQPLDGRYCQVWQPRAGQAPRQNRYAHGVENAPARAQELLELGPNARRSRRSSKAASSIPRRRLHDTLTVADHPKALAIKQAGEVQ